MGGERFMDIQPIVLVGGKSRRFGRDKLREPVGQGGAEWMIDRPIAALRAVFGPCVALVGDCDPAIASRGDSHVADRHPGVGPLGGILTAIEQFRKDIMVLSGDCWAIGPRVIPSILHTASLDHAALAVLAATDHTQWCVGLYRPAIAPHFVRAIEHGDTSLKHAVSPLLHATVAFDPAEIRDADRPEDLAPGNA